MKFAFLLALAAIMPLSVAAQNPNCMTLKKVETDYDALRAGRSMVMYLHFARNGKCHILAPGPQTESRPELAIAPLPGLQVKSTELSFAEIDGIKKTTLQGARKLLLTVHINSDLAIAAGRHELPAFLTYTALDAKGNRATETLTFNLPLQVVAAGTRVKYHDPLSKVSPWVYVAAILLAPILVPLALIGALAGWDGC